MKPYFAKYLPVEGEIREGDYFLSYDETETVKATERFTYHANKEGNKKVKLFLCSRDIQMGDQFFYILTGAKYVSEGSGDNDDRYWILASGTLYAKHQCYKIVGEVSPEATWVKEGDEFDAAQIKRGKRVLEEFIPKVGLETRTYWGDRVKILKTGDNTFTGNLCEYLDEAEINHHRDCKKGETYEYYNSNLGFTDRYYYLIKGPCGHFH